MASEETCAQVNSAFGGLLFILLLLSVLILLILGFTQRRVGLCKGCCGGFPGLVVPLNLLAPTQHRFVYTVIFGALSSNLLNELVNIQLSGSLFPSVHSLAGGLILKIVVTPLFYVLVIAFLYFPVLACVDAPIPFIGHAVGLPYTCLLIVTVALQDTTIYGCGIDSRILSVSAISQIPLYVCFLIILFWYLYHVIKDIWMLATEGRKAAMAVREDNSRYHEYYVRWILKRPPVQRNQSWHVTAFDYLCPYNAVFKFPLRFLAVLAVISMMLYQLTCLLIEVFIILGEVTVELWKEHGHTFLESLRNETHSEVDSLYKKILEGVNSLQAAAALSAIIAFLLCFCQLVHMVASVQ